MIKSKLIKIIISKGYQILKKHWRYFIKAFLIAWYINYAGQLIKYNALTERTIFYQAILIFLVIFLTLQLLRKE